MKHRLLRVQEALKRELSEIIPRHVDLAGAMVTIQEVKVTPDLRHSDIYITFINASLPHEQLLKKLEDARPLLQSVTSKRVVLKFTPQLHFRLDEAIERGFRVLNIMQEVDEITPPEPAKDEDIDDYDETDEDGEDDDEVEVEDEEDEIDDADDVDDDDEIEDDDVGDDDDEDEDEGDEGDDETDDEIESGDEGTENGDGEPSRKKRKR